MHCLRIAILILLGSATTFAESFSPDLQRSEISFYVPAKITNVRGYFRRLSVRDLVFDKKKGITSLRGTVAIDTGSVFTRDRKRDAHLRADDFFYTEKYPEATAKVTDLTLMTADFYQATVILRIRDKTKTYQIPVKIEATDKNTLRAMGTVVVTRGDFDLTGNHVANIIMKDEVEVTFRLVLIR